MWNAVKGRLDFARDRRQLRAVGTSDANFDQSGCRRTGTELVDACSNVRKVGGEFDADALHEALMPQRVVSTGYTEPDYAAMHQELKRKGVTLQLLWSEYVAAAGERAYRYTQFCAHYRQWVKRQKRSMRQLHRAGVGQVLTLPADRQLQHLRQDRQ